jgi:hypothetical protein
MCSAVSGCHSVSEAHRLDLQLVTTYKTAVSRLDRRQSAVLQLPARDSTLRGLQVPSLKVEERPRWGEHKPELKVALRLISGAEEHVVSTCGLYSPSTKHSHCPSELLPINIGIFCLQYPEKDFDEISSLCVHFVRGSDTK